MKKINLFHRKISSLILLLMLTFCATELSAMDVKGVVVDSRGETLIGVSIRVKGSDIGATTNMDGEFYLKGVSENSSLFVTYVGMESQTVLANRPNLRIVLKDKSELLQEVVAIGYATVRKEELTSSISKIGEGDFNGGVTSNPINLVSGKVPGLSIRNVAGSDPNAAPEIQLRGIGSIRAGSTPLIIIDGVYSSMSDLQAINSSDIKSFNVLKDASSAAIYGTRGSNGVIIVETKKADRGKFSIEYNSYYSTEYPTRELELMSADEYLSFLKSKGYSAQNNDYGFSTNWNDELMRDNLSIYQGVSFSTSSDNSSLRASVGYRDNQSMVIHTGNDQLNGRINYKQNFWGDKFVVEGLASGSKTEYRYSDYGAFMQALVYHPTAPVYKANGDFFEYEGVGPYNPVALLSQTNNRGERSIYTASLNATLKLFPFLSLHGTASTNNEHYEGSKYIDKKARQCILDNYDGYAEITNHMYRKNMVETYANFNKNFRSINVGAMAGYSYSEENRTWSNASNRGFLTDALGANNLANGTWLGDGKATMGRGQDQSKLIAFFGRLNFSYEGRYLLNLSARREGSSRFGVNNRWGWFPAVSAAWRIHEENFMDSFDALSSLKLRAGLGVTGNQEIPLYSSLTKYNDRGYSYNNGSWEKVYGPISNPNPDLKWEKNTEFNVGLDFGFWDERFSGSIDYYHRLTSDLLDWYDAQIPSSIYSRIFTNVGSLSNQGVELALGYDVIRKKDFNWHIDVTGSYNQNKLISLSNSSYKANHITYNPLVSPANGQITYVLEEGKPIGTYYGYKYKGFDSNGKWVFEDVNNDGLYSSEDYQYLGNGLPKFNYSLSSRLSWKSFDFSFQFRGAAGFKVLNTKRIYYENPVSLPFNLLKSAMNSPLNDAAVFSDYYLEKGDYLKLDNVTIGYNWSPKYKYLSDVRLYATATNLLTLTSYTGVDPEIGSGLTPGFDNAGYYPRASTIMLGLNIKF